MDRSTPYSFCVINPDEGERTLGWTSIRSPIPSAGNSPNSDFYSDSQDLSDVEINMTLHPAESPVISMDDFSTSTALIHGLSDIELVNPGEVKLSYDIPVVSPSHRGRENMAPKVEQSEQWETLGNAGISGWPSGEGTKYTSFTGVKLEPVEKAYRPEQILSVNTDCFSPGSLTAPEILSGFSDQSTINSTTLHSSSSSLSPETNRQERIWALANAQRQQNSAQSSNSRKIRSFSFSNTDSTELLTRKRAVSDSTRLPPTDISLSANSDTPNCFLTIPKCGVYGQAYTWDSQHQSQAQTPPNFIDAHRPPGAALLTKDHQSPTFVTYQASLYSPAGDARTEQVTSSSLTPHVNTGFKAQVASEAVVEAAKKKRRRRDGAKVFDCPICFHQLTTKQNWQYHMAAHYGKRDHPCGRCGKSFTTPHTRTRHESRCRSYPSPVGGHSG